MTQESQCLLTLFGRLFRQRIFVFAALHSSHPGKAHHPGSDRGPFRLLRLLEKQDGLTNAEIAEKLDIRPSSASAMVKKLLDAQLIKRYESEEDKRMLKICLSEDGRKFITSTRSLRDELSNVLFDSLTDEEKEQLQALLTKLAAGLEKDSPERNGNSHLAELMKARRDLHKEFLRMPSGHYHRPPYDRFPFGFGLYHH